MKKRNNKLWFRAKMFGWGWTPVSWQGWLLTLLYVADIILNIRLINRGAHSGSDFLFSFSFHFVVITILFLVVCYARGERPKFRWGK